MPARIERILQKHLKAEATEFRADREIRRGEGRKPTERGGGVVGVAGGREGECAHVARRRALVGHHALAVSFRRPDRNGVARRPARLELRRDRQARARRSRWGRSAAREGRVRGEAEVLRRLGIGVGGRATQRKRTQVEATLDFRAANARVGAILDLREAVQSKKSKLEFIPILLIDRAVQSQLAAEQGGFCAKFVIGQEIRAVGRHVGAAVDAAGAESARSGPVQ